MKLLFLLALFLWPVPALAQSLEEGLEQVLSGLDLTAFLEAAQGLEGMGDWKETLRALAKGEMVISAQGLV